MGLRRHRGGERKKLLVLAGLWRRRLPELRADFRQHYGVGLGELGRSLPVSEAADLAANLPACARCSCPESWDAGWGDGTWLLARIEHALRVLAWQRSEDGAAGENYPKMITPAPAAPEPARAGVTSDELDEILSRRRG